jgi:hypothetical protein
MEVSINYLDADNNQTLTRHICPKTFQIMAFIFNSVEEGWTIRKKEGTFIFSKKHEGKKEMYEEQYLNTFLMSNLNLEKIILR